jgi:hypothetical protein
MGRHDASSTCVACVTNTHSFNDMKRGAPPGVIAEYGNPFDIKRTSSAVCKVSCVLERPTVVLNNTVWCSTKLPESFATRVKS